MLSKVFFIFSLLYFIGSNVSANGDNAIEKDPSEKSTSAALKYPAKTGFNLAPFPEFRIDPVVGIYFGLNATLFDYGSGDKYPDYDQMYNLNVAWGTKGKTNFSLRYKKYKEHTLSIKLGHSVANLYPFYGYNGYQTYYNENYQDPSSTDYITSAFYNYKQQKTQFDLYLQDDIIGTNFNWLAGIDLNYYDIDRVDFERLNRKAEDIDVVEDTETLYDKYVNWNLIDDSEKNGGWSNSIRTALLYDSRDRLTNPFNGIWAQATVRYSPGILNNDKSALQVGVKHHQFITIVPERISFAYRLRYDATFGDLPFFQKQVLADGIEGYGGATGMVGEGFGTIWGIHQNRVLGRQMALGNFEIRAKLFRLRLFNQNWSTAIVPLFHTGVIIEPLSMDLSNVSPADKEAYFRSSHTGWYSALGLGGKLIMNENIVIGLDWSYALNEEAGSHAIYVGLGYTF